MTKLGQLIESEGMSDLDEYLEAYGHDSVVMGICMNRDCDYTTDVEPDCRRGWCECCETQSVRSGLILAGVI